MLIQGEKWDFSYLFVSTDFVYAFYYVRKLIYFNFVDGKRLFGAVPSFTVFANNELFFEHFHSEARYTKCLKNIIKLMLKHMPVELCVGLHYKYFGMLFDFFKHIDIMSLGATLKLKLSIQCFLA